MVAVVLVVVVVVVVVVVIVVGGGGENLIKEASIPASRLMLSRSWTSALVSRYIPPQTRQ